MSHSHLEPTVFIDDAIVAAAQRGDVSAREELVRSSDALLTWTLRVNHRCASARIDDLKQKTWLRIFENFAQLHDPAKFRSWMRTLATRIAIDDGRRNDARARMFQSFDSNDYADSTYIADPYERALVCERNDEYAQALMDLSSYEKVLIQLHFRWGFTIEDMAPVCSALEGENMPANTVRTRLYRTLKKLRLSVDHSTAAAET